MTTVRSEEDIWVRCGRGITAGGRALGRAAVHVGKGISSAYLAVDPDVRRHVAQLPLLGLTLFSDRLSPPRAITADGQRPIVFVHGLGGHPGNFLPMRKYLGWSGQKRTYAVSLDSRASMSESAEHLSRFIDDVARVNDLPADATIDCVAHSMGGLVARLALEHPATRARIGTLVTMGTPHLGTYAARFGSTPNLLDLRPSSQVMDRLRAQLPWRGRPSQPRLVTLWSPADVFLLPAEAACAPGAPAIEMPDFTHYSYLLNPRAFACVLSILAPAALND